MARRSQITSPKQWRRQMTSLRRTSMWILSTASAMALVGRAMVGASDTSPTHASSVSIEHNKAVARRWSEELWTRGNLAVADEIVAPDYVRHDPEIGRAHV